ncbi:hypothetical protein ACH7BS_10080 [Klebsiella aerogenes]|uniref:hypothetical protein n=1 Tax=Klebsiella aerogenes TaxID=548 RepID=UPI000F6D6836|nr:hypothetical protein [Klebsiella aerogenes]WPS29833.1 hypothetical protein SM913_08700 [Klebsiella aerogenes]VEI09198.1 Uncharacterised protein [Klebsiella aerogenes]HDU5581241.1 hypothetical protein [Klebsiella aerogenes]
MKKVIALALGALLLSGCTSPKYNYAPTTQSLSEPPVGSVNTSYVGDSLLSQGILAKYEGIKVTAPARVSWAYTVTPGNLKKVGQDGKSEFYMPTGMADSANVQKAALADMWQALMVKEGTKTLCVITVFSVSTCEDNMPIEKTNLNISSSNNFQQTLLYNGRVGNKINIGYRESSSDMARPAFNNDVEYDLSESKVIGYKGAKIEVLEATNQSIRYKVISNFR